MNKDQDNKAMQISAITVLFLNIKPMYNILFRFHKWLTTQQTFSD